MNSTAKELSQVDLICNYILMDLELSEQKSFYEKYWIVMELDFRQGIYEKKFDSFVAL